jgi:hypothetical protein
MAPAAPRILHDFCIDLAELLVYYGPTAPAGALFLGKTTSQRSEMEPNDKQTPADERRCLLYERNMPCRGVTTQVPFVHISAQLQSIAPLTFPPRTPGRWHGHGTARRLVEFLSSSPSCMHLHKYWNCTLALTLQDASSNLVGLGGVLPSMLGSMSDRNPSPPG